MHNQRKFLRERDYIGLLLMGKSRESFKLHNTLPPIPEDDGESTAAEEYLTEDASCSLTEQFKKLSLPEDIDSIVDLGVKVDDDVAVVEPVTADNATTSSKVAELEWPTPLPSDGSASDESSISSNNEIILSTTSSGDEFHPISPIVHHPRRRRRRYSNSV